jgi:hypothetical protein
VVLAIPSNFARDALSANCHGISRCRRLDISVTGGIHSRDRLISLTGGATAIFAYDALGAIFAAIAVGVHRRGRGSVGKGH